MVIFWHAGRIFYGCARTSARVPKFFSESKSRVNSLPVTYLGCFHTTNIGGSITSIWGWPWGLLYQNVPATWIKKSPPLSFFKNRAFFLIPPLLLPPYSIKYFFEIYQYLTLPIIVETIFFYDGWGEWREEVCFHYSTNELRKDRNHWWNTVVTSRTFGVYKSSLHS